MFFIRKHLFFSFCLFYAIQLYSMLPLLHRICNTTSNIALLSQLMDVKKQLKMGIDLQHISSGQEMAFSGLGSFECNYYQFKCINETHSMCLEQCIPRHITFHFHEDTSRAKPQDVIDCSMSPLLAIAPLTTLGIATLRDLYNGNAPRVKKFIKLGACSFMYTVVCLYAFEHYTDHTEQMLLLNMPMLLGNWLLLKGL